MVGSGPNGLAAALVLAMRGLSVDVREAQSTWGGGVRTAELTLPGFRHDVCSAIHPFGFSSPFFKTLPLADHGLQWVHPLCPMAHPLDDGPAVRLERSTAATEATLDPADAGAWCGLMDPFVAGWDDLVHDALAPVLRFPRSPFLMSRFGAQAMRGARPLARWTFHGERARALFAGLAAHSIADLDGLPTAAYGLMLGVAGHARGWPFPRGGAQALSDALVSLIRAHGGRVLVDAPVTSLSELNAKVILLDVAPGAFARLAGDTLPAAYAAKLRAYKHGPGSFKLDYALSSPIPWKDPAVARAATVHLGGTLDEIAFGEKAAWEGRIAEKPYVLLAQPSLFDDARAPAGKHTAWAYCHVPNGSMVDQTSAIEAQIERFAPGFRDTVLARTSTSPGQMQDRNANMVGGDIAGGAMDLWQTFFRPTFAVDPYSTPIPGVFLCSGSTPPGGGVHGMSGWFAAQRALALHFKDAR